MGSPHEPAGRLGPVPAGGLGRNGVAPAEEAAVPILKCRSGRGPRENRAGRRWVVRKRRSPHTDRFVLKATLTLTARTQRPPARRPASVHFGLHAEAISWRSGTILSRTNAS